MKAKVFIFLSLLLLLPLSVFGADNRVKGNGKVVTRSVSIGDYESIAIVGSMDFEYEQSSAAPFLSITVDENIYDHISAGVKGGRLTIGYEERRGNNTNYEPTVYKVKSNSKNLRDLSKTGSANFTVKGALRIGSLHITSAGSGDIDFKAVSGEAFKVEMAGSGNLTAKGKLAVDKIELNMAGSGGLTATSIEGRSLECSIAGSGSAHLGGSARDADYSVAGSGSVRAFDCKASDVKASLAGSGEIELTATGDLKASAHGSGNISYRGKPGSVSKESGGSSTIEQVN